MNLQRINPQHTGNSDMPHLLCIACGQWFPMNDGFADLQGEPFKAYYCHTCAHATGAALPDHMYRISFVMRKHT